MLFLKSVSQKTVLFCCLLLVIKAGWAVEPIHIGHVTSVENDVIARTAAGEHKLKIGEKLYFKEEILTKDKGKLEITFRDGSLFTIAPQSVVILDKFIFNPAENVSEKSVNVLKGTFRYISGMAIKNAKTEIKTPFGTAGVRGSADDFKVTEKGMEVFVGDGQVDIKTKNGKVGKVRAGELGTSSSSEVDLAPLEKTAESLGSFKENLGGPDSVSAYVLSDKALKEDAMASNMSAKQQEQALKPTKAVLISKPVNVQKETKAKKAHKN